MGESVSINDVNDDVLASIQGNILQSHARDHAILLFLKFNEVVNSFDGLRKWITSLAQRRINSASHEIDCKRSGPFCSLMISAEGYRFLNLEGPDDSAFIDGMKSRGKLLNDPPCTVWEDGYANQIHAMLIFADNDPVQLANDVIQESELIRNAGATIAIEEPANRYYQNNHQIEHFGFVDGISQPKDCQLRPGEWVTDPEVLLTEDPLAVGHWGAYVVFRKLEQNVLAWDQNIQALARRLDIDPFQAGALAIGRFKDGTPITKKAQMEFPDQQDNDFDFGADLNGSICPHHAHIRKVNNRKQIHPRIARRAMTYGLRPDLHPQGKMFPLPDKGVGLLFMCYQKDIGAGFEYLQKSANDPGSGKEATGPDPMISQGDGRFADNRWPKSRGDNRRITFRFERSIQLLGGEYFFAPSMPFLNACSQIADT